MLNMNLFCNFDVFKIFKSERILYFVRNEVLKERGVCGCGWYVVRMSMNVNVVYIFVIMKVFFLKRGKG